MSTWPQGTITPYGADVLADGAIPNLWVTSADRNHIFYLMGGLAPFPGVQDGIICVENPVGMAAKFKNLDLQAARQDGVTYQGRAYDPAIIKLKLQVHARTPQALSRIMDEWMGAWSTPRDTTLTMEYITPDGGYWTAQVRLMPDSWGDAMKLTPRELGVWDMTHICRIDDSFWTTIPSIDSWGPAYTKFSDTFSTATQSGLGPGWSTIYKPKGSGYEYVGADGEVRWFDTGNSTQGVLNTYTAQATDTDNQVVTVTLGTGWDGVVLFGEATTLIGARMDGEGNGVFCDFGWGGIEVYCVVNGVVTMLYRKINLLSAPLPGETWQFITGAVSGVPRSFAVRRSGIEVVRFTEAGTTSPLGASNRYTGFGMTTAQGLFNEAKPAPIAYFAGGDNVAAAASGYLELSNQGTEDGWPELLFYGPGTWSFGNGPNSTDMITLGPLGDGVVAFLDTLPRRQRVVNMNNLADTSLQKLVSGTYDTPIPGVTTPQLVTLSQIPVSVSGGSASSKIVASVTPRRIHPA
ncbi:hypothetical protein KXD96_28045 (plasmid) [Mycobacterium sp. SMC-2]|uniref:DUF7257 domain-containing protein n=1 Tax=Mycobacterium sp. SMC-2 TaxID=2857058 RepID=UPI0021B24D21|nr:hypothetical protein [Mycobacterium sp. SMC-2]UXA09683.1 hypothetical protein KXD96_28045 [Mycobacterium sp. SMC-2]